ncbi:hypothetical protein M0D21_00460 [Aquimarina sp. D1M17]|uniref:Mut7-C RNAse domain-containing protein n=1 Tax=Aquimarina acroporae TaxID=2937283 RepID=UPI0020C090E5|nr:Mut7-C RNAse domain-containing protein [Aquimarina acroporae]MCK8520021.1 hypothetical protein [Aquimarina acroporae]
MIETIFIIVISALLLGIAAYDWFILWKDLRRCPKCNATLFNVKLLSHERLGQDIKKDERGHYRKSYQCKNCDHTWSIGGSYRIDTDD